MRKMIMKKKKKAENESAGRYTMGDEREIVSDSESDCTKQGTKNGEKRRWKWKKEELREILKINKELNVKENELRYGKKGTRK